MQLLSDALPQGQPDHRTKAQLPGANSAKKEKATPPRRAAGGGGENEQQSRLAASSVALARPYFCTSAFPFVVLQSGLKPYHEFAPYRLCVNIGFPPQVTNPPLSLGPLEPSTLLPPYCRYSMLLGHTPCSVQQPPLSAMLSRSKKGSATLVLACPCINRKMTKNQVWRPSLIRNEECCHFPEAIVQFRPAGQESRGVNSGRSEAAGISFRSLRPANISSHAKGAPPSLRGSKPRTPSEHPIQSNQ